MARRGGAEDAIAPGTADTGGDSSLLQAAVTAAMVPWQVGAGPWTTAWSACMGFWTGRPGGR